ncbi:MAG: IS256 family transposase [Fibrobacter sp.]|nr:IS256 family transposase [Fibrobacter sp.]
MTKTTKRTPGLSIVNKEEIDISTSIGVVLADIARQGKTYLDALAKDMGARLVEAILLAEREQLGGAAYHPKEGYKKWSSQGGSVYIAGGKTKVRVPRLRDKNGEVKSPIYARLKDPGAFSDHLLNSCLSGLSGRRYEDVFATAGEAFGVSRSSVSRKVVAACTKKLKELVERRLTDFEPVAVFMDAMHRCGEVVMAAIGVDADGYKRVLGLWQGSSENTEMCKSFLSDMESRGLALHPDVIFVTDGGTGLNRALKDRFGKELKHQRCVIHKRRNIESHLPEMYRAEFNRRYNNAIGMTTYEDAKRELRKVHEWLTGINASAARSLDEGGERLLTVHRLELPPLLRKSLITTNIIESTFNGLDSVEKNVKRYRDIGMFKRWMAAEVLHREQNWRRLDGYAEIPKLVEKLREKSMKLLDNEALIA